MDPASPVPPWVFWAGGGLVAVILAVLVITQAVLPAFEDEKAPSSDNRTWLEYEWTRAEVNQPAVASLAERLKDYAINRVYVEAAAWRTDGTLLEGDHAADFVSALHAADPNLQILVWLRMSGDEIAQANRRGVVIDLARKAVREWKFDGVQLNGRAVDTGSEAYIQLVRDLRDAVGSDALLSVTVPPDRIPADPDVPIGTTVDPELTWDSNYKQRVALLRVDEIVVMAHASGLENAADYESWTAYQVTSYTDILSELDHPADLIFALPTYDAAPEHDPAVEDVQAAIVGVKAGIKQAGKHGSLVKGVGLYEYKTTDSLEWAQYAEYWLGRKSS
jgi:hypothetical protein